MTGKVMEFIAREGGRCFVCPTYWSDSGAI
jgi:hypothetical protein